jgi:hypothetical protein
VAGQNDPSWFDRLFLKIQAEASPRVAKLLDVRGHPMRDTLYRTALDWLHTRMFEQVSIGESLEFVARGVGASKTTTVTDGPALAEEFSIGDEVFADWHRHHELVDTVAATLRVHFYLNASEVGKVVSFEVDVGSSDSGDIRVVHATIQDTDAAVADQWLDAHVEFTISPTVLQLDFDSLKFLIRRIASSDDPVAHPRVHLVELDYTIAKANP